MFFSILATTGRETTGTGVDSDMNRCEQLWRGQNETQATGQGRIFFPGRNLTSRQTRFRRPLPRQGPWGGGAPANNRTEFLGVRRGRELGFPPVSFLQRLFYYSGFPPPGGLPGQREITWAGGTNQLLANPENSSVHGSDTTGA